MSDEEIRCNEETANALMRDEIAIPYVSMPFQVALGMKMVVSNDMPRGVLQLWQDGKMVKEIPV